MKNKLDLSIIVTAHHEGLIAHKTMLSIERAIKPLIKKDYTFEIIVTIDNGNEETVKYFENYTTLPIKILKWTYKDVAKSRNSAIKEVKGKYISLIDADDLMSKNWLIKSIEFLDSKPYGDYVAHAQYTVEFDGFNSIVEKYSSTNSDQDILLSVFAARWNSVFIAPSKLLKEIPFPHNSPGFGFEDWHVLCSLVERKIINHLIPETVIFVRRKLIGSLWDEHRNNKTLLKKHPIFRPSSFKKIDLNNVDLPKDTRARMLKNKAKEWVSKTPLPLDVATKPLIAAKKVRHKASRLIKRQSNQPSIPTWLTKEWLDIHQLDKAIFPQKPLPKIYQTITPDHYNVGLAYWKICQHLSSDAYDYVLFVPWLMRGGADLFAINYANTVAKNGKKVLVLATNQVNESVSEWKNKLDKNVDFVEFGLITKELSLDQKQRILEQLIENTSPSTLHILNSEIGFDFVRTHEKYISATQKDIIATAYSESTDDTGRIFGFSHTHVPQVYPLLSAITTDNTKIRDMWVKEYAFDKNKIHIHHQPMNANLYKKTRQSYSLPKPNDNVYILWAARLAPEKIPTLIPKIAKLLPSNAYIDMYGTESDEIKAKDIPSHPQVRYKGSFNGFETLPLDKYSLYLYTSIFDGMPNAPLEAALAGLPIVASEVGALPGFIGDNGQIIPSEFINKPKYYADAIKKYLNNPTKYQQKADNLQQEATRKFSEENFESEMKGLI